MLEQLIYEKHKDIETLSTKYLSAKEFAKRQVWKKPLLIQRFSWYVLLSIGCLWLRASGNEQIYLLAYVGIGIILTSLLVRLIAQTSYVYKQSETDDELVKFIWWKPIVKRWVNFGIHSLIGVSLVAYSTGWEQWAIVVIVALVLKILMSMMTILLHNMRLWFIKTLLNEALAEVEQGNQQQLVDAFKSRFSGNPDEEVIMGTDFFVIAKKIEQLLEKVEDAAEVEKKTKLNKGYLMTNLSHDLKTPLTSIVNAVYTLNHQELTLEEKREQISLLNNKLQRLQELIDKTKEILDGKYNEGEAQKAPVDFGLLIENTLKGFEYGFLEKNLEVKRVFRPEEIIIDLDQEKTVRMLENLFGNVQRYALEDTRVYIDVEQDEANEEVKLMIRNVSKYEVEVERSTIGQRFVKGEKARQGEGYGLGLSIVGQLVKCQEGKMQVMMEGDLFKVVITFPSRQGYNENTRAS